MNIKQFIADLPFGQQDLANLYLPVLMRWVDEAGWNVVRSSLYAQTQVSWYRAVRKHMTTSERLADDKRAREWVKAMGKTRAERVRVERRAVQAVITKLLTVLLTKL